MALVQSLTAGVFQDRLIWPFIFDVVTDEEETHLYSESLTSPAASGRASTTFRPYTLFDKAKSGLMHLCQRLALKVHLVLVVGFSG